MNYYNKNINYLLDLKGVSISQFEKMILIPKLKINEPGTDELIQISNYFNVSIDHLIKAPLRDLDKALSRNIKFLILDVDGTMTDGGMYFTERWNDQILKIQYQGRYGH